MNRRIIAALLAFATLPVLHACFARRGEPTVLFPPAQIAWESISIEYVRGIEDGEQDGDVSAPLADDLREMGTDLGQSLVAQDRVALRAINWSVMRPFAQRGIDDKLDDGEIGPGVANSLEERLDNFTETIERLQQP